MAAIYDFQLQTIDGHPTTLAPYQGKVLLIVNVASKCGFTPQYEGLERLFQAYRERGLEVMGFPCNQFKNQEPGSPNEIKDFCRLNYGVSFALFAKIAVNGPDTHPLYRYLKTAGPTDGDRGDIKWNFTKFLVDRGGSVVQRFGPSTEPAAIEEPVVSLLSQMS